MQWPDDCGPVREGPDPSTRLGSSHSAAFFPMRQRKYKADVYHVERNANPDLDARSVVRLCTGFVPFSGTGAKAVVRILTFGPRSISHLLNRVPYHLKILKSPKKSRFTQKVARICLILSKTVVRIFLKVPEWDANLDPDLRIRTRQKSIKTRNVNIFGSGRDPDPRIGLKIMWMNRIRIPKSGFKNFYEDPRFA